MGVATPTTVPASLVRELRELTQAPMMDCKRALEESHGDLEEARRLLRERGLAQAQKRAGRATTEGTVAVLVSDSHGTMVAVGCETESVARSSEFQGFVEQVLAEVDHHGQDALEALDVARQELSGKLQENVQVQAVRLDVGAGESVAGYVHPPANKLGVLVRTRGGSEELAKRLAMHIAASDPRYLKREDVPESEVAYERDVFSASDAVKGKPEQAKEKIVDGMLEKRFFAQSVLLEQDWVLEPSRKVKDVLANEDAECLEFTRLSVAT